MAMLQSDLRGKAEKYNRSAGSRSKNHFNLFSRHKGVLTVYKLTGQGDSINIHFLRFLVFDL